MRGINRVIVSGVVAAPITFAKTDSGAEVCTFGINLERHANGSLVTASVKINVYMEALVRLARTKLSEGCYLIVEGELMNRQTPHGRVTEVRAWEMLFI